MLSLPIPDETSGQPTYNELAFGSRTYAAILSDLGAKQAGDETCHLDPDIRPGVRVAVLPAWKPAFGQTGAAQGHLHRAGVGIGDIFLFFGWFRQSEVEPGGQLRFVRRGKDPAGADVHAIYGYLQVGRILTNPADIRAYAWHPHALPRYWNDHTNALYLPAEHLSLDPELPGCGVLDYRSDRILTAPGHTKAVWTAYPFLLPDNLIRAHRRNASSEPGTLFFQGIFQELVYEGTSEMQRWLALSFTDGWASAIERE